MGNLLRSLSGASSSMSSSSKPSGRLPVVAPPSVYLPALSSLPFGAGLMPWKSSWAWLLCWNACLQSEKTLEFFALNSRGRNDEQVSLCNMSFAVQLGWEIVDAACGQKDIVSAAQHLFTKSGILPMIYWRWLCSSFSLQDTLLHLRTHLTPVRLIRYQTLIASAETIFLGEELSCFLQDPAMSPDLPSCSLLL